MLTQTDAWRLEGGTRAKYWYEHRETFCEFAPRAVYAQHFRQIYYHVLSCRRDKGVPAHELSARRVRGADWELEEQEQKQEGGGTGGKRAKSS